MPTPSALLVIIPDGDKKENHERHQKKAHFYHLPKKEKRRNL
jgi:hypothetical protein